MLGIAFIILFIVGVVVQGETPVASDSPDEIREFFVDNRDSYLIGDFLVGVALLFFFLPFTMCLHSLLIRAENGPGVMSNLFVGGVVLTLAVAFAGSLGWGTLAMGAGDDTLDDSALKTLMYMEQYGSTGIQYGFAIATLAASIVMLTTATPARWLGYLGIAAFVLNIIGAAWVIDGDEEGVLAILGFIGILAVAVWTLGTSIVMLRQKQPIGAEEAVAAV